MQILCEHSNEVLLNSYSSVDTCYNLIFDKINGYWKFLLILGIFGIIVSIVNILSGVILWLLTERDEKHKKKHRRVANSQASPTRDES